ncbi:hypothetical protein AK830_g9545 [Neonectria ditissima]|uniref:Uncharacterized protein n=1 Tax=Neonectria ditissima TaxID=78410 RepID=A0A0P7AHU7_9HYPO|nr:hypothetical protein AK830_g9545 [Neonectria ditissima]
MHTNNGQAWGMREPGEKDDEGPLLAGHSAGGETEDPSTSWHLGHAKERYQRHQRLNSRCAVRPSELAACDRSRSPVDFASARQAKGKLHAAIPGGSPSIPSGTSHPAPRAAFDVEKDGDGVVFMCTRCKLGQSACPPCPDAVAFASVARLRWEAIGTSDEDFVQNSRSTLHTPRPPVREAAAAAETCSRVWTT